MAFSREVSSSEPDFPQTWPDIGNALVTCCQVSHVNELCFVAHKTIDDMQNNTVVGWIKVGLRFRCRPGHEVLPGRCTLGNSSMKIYSLHFSAVFWKENASYVEFIVILKFL